MNKSTSLTDLASKVGIPLSDPISLLDIAQKIGYKKTPISMSDLADAVDEFVTKNDKMDK